MILILISNDLSSCEEAGLNRKKRILMWFCEAIISYGIFNQEMKECLSFCFGSLIFCTVVWNREKKIR